MFVDAREARQETGRSVDAPAVGSPFFSRLDMPSHLQKLALLRDSGSQPSRLPSWGLASLYAEHTCFSQTTPTDPSVRLSKFRRAPKASQTSLGTVALPEVALRSSAKTVSTTRARQADTRMSLPT